LHSSSFSLALRWHANDYEEQRSDEMMSGTLIEYVLIGLVALGIVVYLVFALLAPEKF
jgi:K+-transporting ATPase KdpF subunit